MRNIPNFGSFLLSERDIGQKFSIHLDGLPAELFPFIY